MKLRLKKIKEFDNSEEAFLFCNEKNKYQQKPKYMTFRVNKNLYVVRKILLPVESIEEQIPERKISGMDVAIKRAYVRSKIPEIIELRNQGMFWKEIGKKVGLHESTCKKQYDKNI